MTPANQAPDAAHRYNSSGGSSWLRQFWLIYIRNIKRLYREKVSFVLQFFWPLAVFLSFLLLRQAYDILQKPACFSKPVALPSAGTIPYLQSMICGLSMQCFDEPVDDPYQFYNRAIVPRLWEDLQPVMLNKTRMQTLGEMVRGMKVFVDAFKRFRDNSTVRSDSSKVFHDLGAMAMQGMAFGRKRRSADDLLPLMGNATVNDVDTDWSENEHNIVKRMAEQQKSFISNILASPLLLSMFTSGSGGGLNLASLFNSPQTQLVLKVLPPMLKPYFEKLISAGLFESREAIDAQWHRMHVSQELLQHIADAFGDALPRLFSLAQTSMSAFSESDRSGRATHFLNFLGDVVCGHGVVDASDLETIQLSHDKMLENREKSMEKSVAKTAKALKKNKNKNAAEGESLLRDSVASSEQTMKDLSVLFEDLGFAAHAMSSRGIQRLVQRLDVQQRNQKVLSAADAAAKKDKHADDTKQQRVHEPLCTLIRSRIEHTLYGNIILTHMKPFTHGRIVYTIDASGDAEFEAFAERVMHRTAAGFHDISLTLSHIESMANVGAAVYDLWQHELDRRDEQALVWILQRFVVTEEFQQFLIAPSATSASSAAWQLASVLLFARSELNDEISEMVDRVLDLIAEAVETCLKWESRTERVASETLLEQRARGLELTHELFGAIVLSKPFDVTERERNSDGWDDHLHDDANAHIRYKIRIDKDRLRDTSAVDQFFDPPGPFVNAVDDLRNYFGFVPLQDIVERAVLEEAYGDLTRASASATTQSARKARATSVRDFMRNKRQTDMEDDFPAYEGEVPTPTEAPSRSNLPAVARVNFSSPHHQLTSRIFQHRQNHSKSHFPALFAEQLPYPCYEKDDFKVVELMFLPIMSMLAWSYAIGTFARYLVMDREHGYDVLMRLYGLKPAVLTAAWFATVLTFGVLVCLPVTAALKYGQLLVHSDFGLLFVIVFLCFLVMMCLNFFVVSFTSKGSTAAALALVANVACGLPAIYVVMHEIRYLDIEALRALCLAPNTALVLIITYAIRYEQDAVGLQWENVNWSPILFDSFSAWSGLKILIFDAFLYIGLGICVRLAANMWNKKSSGPTLLNLLRLLANCLCFCCFWRRKKFQEDDSVKLLKYREVGGELQTGAFINDPSGQKKSIVSRAVPTNYLTRSQSTPPTPSSMMTAVDLADGVPSLTSAQQPTTFVSDQTSSFAGVDVRNLTVIYPTSMFKPNVSLEKRTAVRDVSLKMQENEITCLLGPNGAGKSTTISVICGVRSATQGTVYIAGHNVTRDRTPVQDLLGYCPQKDVLFDWLTIREHIELYGQLRGYSGFALECDVDKMINGMGLKRYADWLPMKLSGGYRRRCMMAIAFSCQSRVVILDEPTSGVDPAARCHLWHLITTQKHGRTILLTTHHLDEADYLADKVAILARGQLQAFGTAGELRSLCNAPPNTGQSGPNSIPALLPESSSSRPSSVFLKIVKDKPRMSPEGGRFDTFIRARLTGSQKVHEDALVMVYLVHRSRLANNDSDADHVAMSFMTELEQKRAYYGVADVFFEVPKLDAVYAMITGGEDALDSEDGRPTTYWNTMGSTIRSGGADAAMADSGARHMDNRTGSYSSLSTAMSPTPTPTSPMTIIDLQTSTVFAGPSPPSTPYNSNTLTRAELNGVLSPSPAPTTMWDKSYQNALTSRDGKWRDFYSDSPAFHSRTWRQLKALTRKRYLHLTRDLKSTLSLLVTPIMLIVLALLLASDRPKVTSSWPMDLNPFYMYWHHPLFFAYNVSDATAIITSASKTSLPPSRIGGIDADSIMHTMLEQHVLLTRHLPRSWGKRYFMNKYARERLRTRFENSVAKREQYVEKEHKLMRTNNLAPIISHEEHEMLTAEEVCTMSNDHDYVGIWTAFERKQNQMYHLMENVSDVYGHESTRYILPRNRLDRKLFGGYSLGTSKSISSNTHLSSQHPSAYIRVWNNIRGRQAVPAYLSYINSVLLASLMGKSQSTSSPRFHPDFENRLIPDNLNSTAPIEYNVSVLHTHRWRDAARIAAYSHPLPLTEVQQSEYTDAQNSGDVGVTLLLLQALSIVPCALIIYAVREKAAGERRLQYLAGVSPWLYWLTAYLCDMAVYTVVWIVCAGLFALFRLPVFWDSYNYRAVLALIYGYGWSAMPLMYIASHMFNDGALAFVSLFCFNTLTSIVFMALVSPSGFFFWMGSTKQFVPKGPIFDSFPGFLFGNGVLDMIRTKLESYMMHKYICVVVSNNSNVTASNITHSFDEEQDENKMCKSAPFPDPFQWDIIGRFLFIMFMQGIVFFIINLVIEYLRVKLPHWRGSVRTTLPVEKRFEMARSKDGRDHHRRRNQREKQLGSISGRSNAAFVGEDMTHPGYVTENDMFDWEHDVDEELNGRKQQGAQSADGDVAFLDAGISNDSQSQVNIATASSLRGAMTRAELKALEAQEPLIEVQNVWFSYRTAFSRAWHWLNSHFRPNSIYAAEDGQMSTSYAVRGANLSVMPGQCYGLLGFNGSGKSTLFKMLSADLSATDGCIEFNFDWQKRPNAIGYCPQYDALDHFCTVREMLEIYAVLKGLNYPKAEASDCIRQLGLEPFEGKLTKDLSGGNARKLSAAIAFLGSPNLVLLDEATSGMDQKARACMAQYIRGYLADSDNDGGGRRAVVLTSHKMGEAAMLCSRLTILADGQVKCEGSPEDIRERYGAGLYVLLVRFNKALPSGSAGRKSFVDSTMESARVENGRIRIKTALEQAGFSARVRRDGNNMLEFLVRGTASSSMSDALEVNVHEKQQQPQANNGAQAAQDKKRIRNIASALAAMSSSTTNAASSFKLYQTLETMRVSLGIAEYELRRATLSEVFSCIAMARRKSTMQTPIAHYMVGGAKSNSVSHEKKM